MKQRITLIVILYFSGWSYSISQDCFLSGITFSTQSELDQFIIDNPDCTTIGTVLIEGSDITSLAPLDNITVIQGDLKITNCASLVQLIDLNAVEIISGELEISLNPSLIQINNFIELKNTQNILIGGNDKLERILGFSSFFTISGDINISNNKALTTISSFEDLNFIQGSLIFGFNPSLKEMSGFNSVIEIEEDLVIFEDTLQIISGLQNLLTIRGVLQFQTILNLENFDGLSNLTFAGDILITDSNVLENLSGLKSLLRVDSGITLSKNVSLIDISDLGNINQFIGVISVRNNPKLSSLKGLQNIDYEGIEGLILEDNESLEICSVKPICDYLNNPDQQGEIFGIGNNATGCNSEEEVIENCLPDSTAISVSICDGESINILDQEYSDFGFFEQTVTSCLGIDSVLHITIFEASNCGDCQIQNSTLGFQITVNETGEYLVSNPNKTLFISANKLKVISFVTEQVKQKNSFRTLKNQIPISENEMLDLISRIQKGGVLKI